MKIAYIAHPIGGDIKRNLQRITTIIRKINLKEPDVVPFAPYMSDMMAMHDQIPTERDRGIKNDIALMKKGFIDEVRLYGTKISAGMAAEVKLANKLGIPIVPMTPETLKEFTNYAN